MGYSNLLGRSSQWLLTGRMGLREIRDVWKVLQGSRLHATIDSMAYYHSKSMAYTIQNVVCLNWLYLYKPEGRHTKQTVQQGSNGTRHPSRPIILCNPFRCIFNYLCFKYLRDFGFAWSLRVQELARSLWKVCARACDAIQFFKE